MFDKTWKNVTLIGTVGLAFLGTFWYHGQLENLKEHYESQIKNIVIPSKIDRKEIITSDLAKEWEEKVYKGIDLHLKDAMPKYEGESEGEEFLNVLFPLPEEKELKTHEERENWLKHYQYKFNDFQLIKVPSKSEDGEAILKLEEITYKGEKNSWQAQAPYMYIKFNKNGFITGGDYYANAEG